MRRAKAIEKAIQDERLRAAGELETARRFMQTLGNLAVTGQEPVASAFASTLLALDEPARTDIVRTTFHVMPADRQASFLIDLFGDDSFRRALAVESRLQQEKHNKDWLELIRGEAEAHGRVDLAQLPVGTDVVLGLFTAENIDEARDWGGEADGWGRQLKLRSLSGGQLHVLTDEYSTNPSQYGNPEVTPDIYNQHDIIELGTRYNRGSAPDFDHYIFQGTPLVSRLAVRSEFVTSELLVGYVQLDSRDAFALTD